MIELKILGYLLAALSGGMSSLAERGENYYGIIAVLIAQLAGALIVLN